MGWTSYMATNYKNGKINVKAEMDKIYTWSNEKQVCKVLKSSMVGRIYYGAIEITKENSREVVAAIAITSTSCSDGMNFGYKGMDESMIPCYYDCPKGIMELLTPTDNAESNEWRKRVEEKRNKPSIGKLPIGSVIRYKLYNGTEITLKKCAPAYQFKTPWWYNEDNGTYVSKRNIPTDFEVIR